MTTTLSPSDWEQINHAILRLHRELEHEQHARVMLEVLNDLVPADLLAVNIFDAATRGYQAILLPDDGAITPDVLQNTAALLHQSPFPAYFAATSDGGWKATTDFMPLEDLHATELFRRYATHWRANEQMCGMLAALETTMHAIVINRLRPGFTERERAILTALHPHLVTSYVNALLFSRSQNSARQLKAAMATAPGAYGCFNADGRTAWMQPKAQAWLLEFFPDEVKTNGSLPRRISQLVEKSRASGGTPEHLEVQSARERLNAMLSTSPMGGWILRLERTPLNPAPRFRPLDQLSAAENRVLKWMVEGKRNAEIATILGLSPRTVEKHVEEILAEFGVENRATAIIRAMELCAAER